MVNTLEIKVVGSTLIVVQCSDCKYELEHVLKFEMSGRVVCPYCGQELDKNEIILANSSAIKIKGSPALEISASLPNGTH